MSHINSHRIHQIGRGNRIAIVRLHRPPAKFDPLLVTQTRFEDMVSELGSNCLDHAIWVYRVMKLVLQCLKYGNGCHVFGIAPQRGSATPACYMFTSPKIVGQENNKHQQAASNSCGKHNNKQSSKITITRWYNPSPVMVGLLSLPVHQWSS